MIRFVVFEDLHYDEVFDGEKRVNELVEHIKAVKPDLCYFARGFMQPD